MKRGPGVLAILLLLALVPALNAIAASGLEREYQKTVALRSGGAVEIRNVSGSVTVSGWDREEVEIHAVIALNVEMAEAEAAKLLEAVEIKVEHGWNKVNIKTVYPAERVGC